MKRKMKHLLTVRGGGTHLDGDALVPVCHFNIMDPFLQWLDATVYTRVWIVLAVIIA